MARSGSTGRVGHIGADPTHLSFSKSLFSGVVADELVFPYPEMPRHDVDRLATYLGDLRRFLDAKVDAAAFDRAAGVPEEVVDGLAELGAFGLYVPTKYGGLGFSQSQTARVMELVAARDPGLGVLLGAHQSIGFKAIHLFGSESQKQRWLPACASGEVVAAFALTEPAHGSDAAHIESRAERSQSGDRWVLNGHKIWIGNGQRAGLMTVFAQTPVERNGEIVDRVSAFVVESADPGVEVGRLWTGDKLGIRSSTQAEILFRDVPLPDDRLIGEPGHGFKIAMHVLHGGRLGLAASAVGAMRVIEAEAIDFATTRQQFGRPIAEFDLIAAKLARMRIDAYVTEAMVYLTAGLVDRGGVDCSVESAICKVFASEAAWRTADAAVQVAGGRGYVEGLPFERHLRDARILPIFEGTNEVLRLFIALAGIEPLADELESVGRALREPIKEIGVLTEFAFHQIRDVVGTSRTEVEVDEVLTGCLRHFERYTAHLHRAAEHLIREHRDGLVDQQLQLARLADMAIDLYAMIAVISRVEARIARDGPDTAAPEIDIARYFCRLAGARIRRQKRGIEKNRDPRVRRIAGHAIAEHKGARG